MMRNQDGWASGVGNYSMPAKLSNAEYPNYPSYYAAPGAPPSQPGYPTAPPAVASAPTAPPAAYATSAPPKENLYPKIHQPAQPGYATAPSNPSNPTPPPGYTQWASGATASFQYVRPSYDSVSYSPYTADYTPYTPPAPPGGYGSPAPPSYSAQYQGGPTPSGPYDVPPSSLGYQGTPPFPQGGNPYVLQPGPYGAPPAVVQQQPSFQHLGSMQLGGSGRVDDRFRANTMGGPPSYVRMDSGSVGGPPPYVRMESGSVGGPPPYVRMDSGSVGGPPPYVRMDSGSVGGPPPYIRSESTVSLQPPVYHSGPIYGGYPGGGGNQYVPGAAHPLPPRNTVTDMVPIVPHSHPSAPPTMLHGTLKVTIVQAKNLPNMDGLSQQLSNLASGLSLTKKSPTASDPYVTVVLANARVARTCVINNNAFPKWDEHFSIPVAHPVHYVVFVIRDQDVIGTDKIGEVKIPVEKVLNGGVVSGWFDVVNSQGRLIKNGAQLELTASYVPVEQDLVYTRGVAGGDSHAVPHTYFPCRKGCRLTLYQDTHIYEHTLPIIRLDGGQMYEPRRCWEDLCQAIYDAKHLIYIAGWSVYDKVRLIRDQNRAAPVPVIENGTLGELLKFKAKQGVRVLLLVWDDKTSHDLPFIKLDGVMNTHDEETKKYFKGTGVRCVLAARYGASKMSWFKQKVVGTLYSHHQKMTIVDTGNGHGDQRTVTSFIGGLDLTGGRWDTPSHCLFASLEAEHKNDFRNKSWPHAPDSGGPRQPWHDWHCKIEGHAAYDVLTNFEQRWRKATKTYDDELLNIDRREGLVGPSNQASSNGDPALTVTYDHDAETWQVQIFRSIDSGSVKGFPVTAKEVTEQSLVWGKSVAIDISIQMAYIKAIRCAQHFVYIENQYFLGSSYNWPDYKTAGANHLIPMELALKICSKIKEGKRFAVYIVIPMWPEGIPDSGPVQEMLYFQTQTMKMMYRLIADTLRDCGSMHQKPTDYLNFYCLGTRETKKPGEPEPRNPPPASSNQAKSQRSRRMMIYVHSKGMIVDDEYVISGSANINQRSMDGSRDTEIAMGGYQPQHTWLAQGSRPRGQVYGYRMSLWAEHLGPLQPIFEEPESLECVRKVNDMADRNWQQYAAPEITDMAAHLIRYPLKIEDDGTIRNLPGVETFPDVGGKIVGSNQEQLPDDLTA